MRADFRPEYFPRANGRVGPAPDAIGRNDRIKLEFLAVYYRLNCEYARLLQARAKAESPECKKTDAKCLRAIETILIVRDGLEDKYASCGVIAEPIVSDGFTMDVKFTFGDVTAAGRLRSAVIVSSAVIAVGLPPGIAVEKLTFPEQGSRTREQQLPCES